MTMALISPSGREVSPAEQLCRSSRLVPPRFRLVAAESRPERLLLIFFLIERLHIGEDGRQRPTRGPTRQWGAPQGGTSPTLVRRVWAPGLHLWQGFFIIFSKMFRGVSGHSENICFLHIKQHHGNSAENNVSPGQFHSNHTRQSPKQGQKCLEKQI